MSKKATDSPFETGYSAELYTMQKTLVESITKNIVEENPFAQFIYFLIRFFLSATSLTVEVFWRRKFGERYLANSVLAVSVLFLLITRYIGEQLPRSSSSGISGYFTSRLEFIPNPTILTNLFITAFIGIVIYHRVRIFQRNWVGEGEAWHSYSSGIPHLKPYFAKIQKRVPFIPNLVQHFVEPLCTLIVAALMPDPFLNWWLNIAGISLFIKEVMMEQATRNRDLDMLDLQIQSAAAAMLQEAQAAGTNGSGEVSVDGFNVRVPLVRIRKSTPPVETSPATDTPEPPYQPDPDRYAHPKPETPTKENEPTD